MLLSSKQVGKQKWPEGVVIRKQSSQAGSRGRQNPVNSTPFTTQGSWEEGAKVINLVSGDDWKINSSSLSVFLLPLF